MIAEYILFLSLLAGMSLWVVVLQFKLRKAVQFGLMMTERCKTLSNILLKWEARDERERARPVYAHDDNWIE